MERKKAIGLRLKATRERLGLQQKETAKKVGVHPSTLNKYESGDREPDTETLVKLADLYGVSLDFLAMRSRARLDKEGDTEESQTEFARWVEENVSATFFYDFHRSPEESKAQLMRDLRMVWEYERKNGGK